MLAPILFEDTTPEKAAITEIISVMLYGILQIILPELLHVNNISSSYLAFFFLPLLLLGGSAFNPCAIYALWFIHGYSHAKMQPERIIAPFLGSMLASLFCSWSTPDDPKSWKSTIRYY